MPSSDSNISRWPIERTWILRANDSRLGRVSTTGLQRYRACGILGAAGLGKTYELRYLADVDRQGGRDVRIERLAVLGQTADGLASQLRVLSSGASEDSVIFLDALDEVMVPVKVAGLVVERWIRDELVESKPTLRISCRSAVWPSGILAALEEIYGDDQCAVAMLQPLSRDDVKIAASNCGVDAAGFEAAVQAAGANILLQQPLTLKMLLRLYAQGGALPRSRSELFARGIEELASERFERLEGGTIGEFTTVEIVEAAERLACISLLSGRETVDLSDTPSSSSLGRIELGGLPDGQAIDDRLLRAIGTSGICDSDGTYKFRFAHRQFAEYLAGRRLAKLLFHQSRAALSSRLGWQAGVAGPLRETAAFAAMYSDAVAAWVAEYDPEVIGLSDVADDPLRRRATLRLLEKFRKHELTDIHLIGGDQIALAGFHFEGAEADLRAVLKERGVDCDDVLQCAVALIETWQLESMSDDLADLMLDRAAPLEARRAAGYALMQMRTAKARQRLKSLISDDSDDLQLDLKGLALRCTWPDSISTDELLAAISTPASSSYGGAYQNFLFELERSDFAAADNRLGGLTWSLQFMNRDSDIAHQGRIARRIAIASVDDLGQPGIADALADVILTAAKNHAGSPLTLPARFGDEEGDSAADARLHDNQLARRTLIDALTARPVNNSVLWWAVHEIESLVITDDFAWLLQQAVTTTLPMPQREKYAELARSIRWQDKAENVDAWLSVRTVEPVASRFPFPLYMELESEESAKARREFHEATRRHRPPKKKKLQPPPKERVEHTLKLSETKDSKFFINLSQELTLEEYSTHYRFSRFVTKTPGWGVADAATQTRIVEAAKRMLTDDTDEPERCRSVPLNSILSGYMAAIWLVMERQPSSLEELPKEWWQRWCWYILRELHPFLSGESSEHELKVKLLEMLHTRAPQEVRAAVEELATSASPESGTLSSLLQILSPIGDSILDERLHEHLIAGRIPTELSGNVARFILTRQSGEATLACTSCLEPEAVSKAEGVAVSAAVALMQQQPYKSWPFVREFLEHRPDLAPKVLGEFAHGDIFGTRRARGGELDELDCAQIGQLVELLFVSFPPESDSQDQGAGHVGPGDSGRRLRDQLVSWLGEQADVKAVEALRLLERRYSEKYPWLRRPRARAEQAYRRSSWVPIPPRSVAEVLAAQTNRLIRSGQDAVEGVVTAIEQYAHQLRNHSPNELDDLWNRPSGTPPTPKEEERVSDKICVAIRNYFHQYAVTADREVQIFRRKLPAATGGAPGSEVDVLCRVPAAGVVNVADPIAVPVEVKLSHNREARTGLPDQLLGRYMAQLDTSFGVYVVAWMGKPTSGAIYRPVWKTLTEAEDYLNAQVTLASAETEGLCIRTMVIDTSLPTVKAHEPSSTKKKANSKGTQSKKRSNSRKNAAAKRKKKKR